MLLIVFYLILNKTVFNVTKVMIVTCTIVIIVALILMVIVRYVLMIAIMFRQHVVNAK